MPDILKRLNATHPFLQIFLCFFAGSVSALAMAPINGWPTLFLGLSALYILLTRSTSKTAAFLKGWAFGFGYFLFSLSWIGNALLVEGNDYAWAWPLAVCGLPAGLALFIGCACLLAWRFSNLKTLPGYLSFSAFLISLEWLRGHIFTGFPWNLFGYTWADYLPVIQMISFSNIYYLTWLTILWTSLAGFLIVWPQPLKNKALLVLTVSATFMLCYSYGARRLEGYVPQYHKNVQIRIVQPNIPQPEKWDRSKMAENFFKHLRLSYPDLDPEKNAAETTYIIWPETALSQPFLDDRTSMDVLKQMLSSHQGSAYLLTGALRHNSLENTYYNSLVMLGGEENFITNIYDKHHLVPFGEYIPFQKWMPLRPVVQFISFVRGKGAKTYKTPQGMSYSPFICYEVIFPGTLINTAQPQPDFLLNVTNDAWYGNSAGPYQHFTQAVFRAIEEGTPLIRSANTGISALIGPMGNIKYRSEIFVEDKRTMLLPQKVKVKRIDFLETYLKYMGIWLLIIATIIFGGVKKEKLSRHD